MYLFWSTPPQPNIVVRVLQSIFGISPSSMIELISEWLRYTLSRAYDYSIVIFCVSLVVFILHELAKRRPVWTVQQTTHVRTSIDGNISDRSQSPASSNSGVVQPEYTSEFRSTPASDRSLRPDSSAHERSRELNYPIVSVPSIRSSVQPVGGLIAPTRFSPDMDVDVWISC